jgi:hypothetical protein
MGKTGTTHLQLEVFPELDRLGILHYRTDLSKKIEDNMSKHDVFNESSHTKFDFGLDKFSDDSIHLISNELLLSWDPRDWQISLSNLLSDFGEESEILITLRDPYSYLRSLYQQKIHQGESDLAPEHYFLRSDLYDKHRDYFGWSNGGRRFSVDELDYNYLFNSFAKKFSRVYFSDMKTTMEYKFLIDMNIIDSPLCERLREKIVTKMPNKAYSKKAMFLDNKRYKILNAMGLMPVSASINSRNQREQLIFYSCEPGKETHNITPSISKNVVSLSLENLKRFIKQCRTIYKILNLPYKLLTLPHTFFRNWRFFLQGYVNVLFKYEKFELPAEMYLGKHFEDNVDFYKELPLSKGYQE